MKTLYILDCMGLIFRSYHAIAPMSNSQGQATHATFGFIRTLLKVLKDFKPEALVCVFDGKNNKASRVALYADYKANRPPPPPDLKEQIAACHRVCEDLGIPVCSFEGIEADDTIGALAQFWNEQGGEAAILSSDKDLCQLVNAQTYLIDIYKKNRKLSEEQVIEQYGIKPSQFVDYLALIGDSSDNIPGVRSIGPKTASSLLQTFDSLENILARVDEIKGAKKQQVLKEEAEMARLSQKLAQINFSAPIDRSVVHYVCDSIDLQTLIPLLEELEFFSILEELSEGTPSLSKESYHLVETEEEIDNLLQELNAVKEIAVDTETTSLHPVKGDLVGISLCAEIGKAYYIPFNHKLSKELLHSKLQPFFASDHCWIGHNIKYDAIVLAKAGLPLSHLGFDTALASYVLHAHSRRHSLDELSLQYFGKKKISIKSLIGSGKNEKTMDQVPVDEVAPYACEDADYTFRLKGLLSPELTTRGLHSLFIDLEMPLIDVLVQMEQTGIYIDKECLKGLHSRVHTVLKNLEEEIYQLAGEEFKINSPKQLSHILFEKLGISPPKKTATGFSTSAEVLEFLQDRYPIAEHLLQYRLHEKLRSTYIDALPNEIYSETGRVHPSFNQFIASTGRLSCQNPNLQNIPIRTEEGREIRRAFRPQKEGWKYLCFDYSQIELRLLAHMSQDPSLLAAFNHREDIHTHTASLIFHVPIEEVTKEMRYHAKTVNFGIIYGQQAFGLAKELKIGIPEASKFIKTYFERYPAVQTFIESCVEQVKEKGYAETLLGRQRMIPEIHHKNKNLRSQAERLSVNTPIQGSAADLIKLAMLKVSDFIRKEQPQGMMILQVHDELIFEVPEEEVSFWQEKIPHIMETVHTLDVPLLVDMSIGNNWKECYN